MKKSNDEIIDDEIAEDIEPLMPRDKQGVWLILLSIGIFLKLLKVPGNAFLILATTGGLTAETFARFFDKSYKTSHILWLVTEIAWLLLLVKGAFFGNGRPYNLKGFSIYITVFVLIFFKNLYQQKRSK